ncbi:MAG: NADH-quinone oxidoreductase subunit NuoG, partial [Terriglobales bacterium]
GWNSPQAQLLYPQTTSGSPLVPHPPPLSPGPRLAPSPRTRRPGPRQFWLLLRPHLFGSEELSAHARAIAALAPKPYVALNPDDAARCGFVASQRLRLSLEGKAYALPLALEPSLPSGLALVPAGTAAFNGESLPAWITLDPAPKP